MSRLWIRQAVIYLAAFILFTGILLNRSPNLLRPLSMNVRFGFALLIPVVFLILYLVFFLPGWPGKLLSLTATLSLFALALAGVWASGHTQSVAISGLLPLYDAQAYYIDALRLLAGREILEFSAARPLFTGLLSTLLAMTDRNLMMVLAILTAANALACYFIAKEIQQSHGHLAAVFLLIFLFLYYRYRTIGTVMSENLGFPLGILGVALIWRGITNRDDRLVVYGLFLHAIALNTRPGPLFILLAILLWGSWHFREPGKHFSWRFFLAGLAAIGAAFVLNLVMVRLVGVSSSVPFSQFSYALYGLAAGGKSWSYIFEVHPELAGLLEPEKTQTVYKLTFALIRSDPALLLQGALHNWSLLLSNSWYNVFSFASGENNSANMLARGGLYLLCVLGIIKWLQDKSDPYTGFVIAAAIGVLISVPFVPPADAYGMRLYAASIVIFGLLPMLGLVFSTEKLRISALDKPSGGATDPQSMIWYAAVLLLFLLIGPLFVRGSSQIAQATSASCQPGSNSIALRVDPGSSVHVIREREPGLDWLPVFHQGIFKRNAHGLTDRFLVKWLETIRPATTLFSTLDYQSNQAVLVTLPTSMLPRPGSSVKLCGRWENDPVLQGYNIFISEEVQAVTP